MNCLQNPVSQALPGFLLPAMCRILAGRTSETPRLRHNNLTKPQWMKLVDTVTCPDYLGG